MNKSNGGRPYHDYWSRAYFEAIKVEGRSRALCLLCNKILKNTAKSRLALHRNICPRKKSAIQQVNTNFVKVEQSESYKGVKVKTEKIQAVRKDDPSTSSTEQEINEEVADDSSDQQEQYEELYEVDFIQEGEECQKEIMEFSCEKMDRSEFFENDQTTSNDQCSFKVNEGTSTSEGFSNRNSEENSIDETLAEFFIACNIPFPVADSIHFHKFVKRLNSSYAIPKTKKLISNLMDRVHEKHKCIPKIITDPEKTSVLLLSGFNHSNGVVACIQTDDGSRQFLNFWDFDGEICGRSDTSVEELNGRLNRVNEILDDCREIAKDLFNSKVHAAVFDGLEISASLDSLWCTTCNSHEANLLAQDVTDPNLIESVIEILKLFEKPELEEKLAPNSRIVIPWTGKWCTYREAIHCFIQNFSIMSSTLLSGKIEVPKKTLEIILNENFISEVQSYSEALDAICKLIYTCQKKKTLLSEAAEEWLTLNLSEKFENVLEERKKVALSPCAMAANFVDPRFRGKCLTDQQLDVVEDFFLEQLSADGLDDLFLFKANNGIFKVMWEKNIITPMTFWGLAERKHPEFSKLAKNLLKIPASASQLEKLFSDFSKIHMPVRNMLGLEKLRKLIKTHFALRFETNHSERIVIK